MNLFKIILLCTSLLSVLLINTFKSGNSLGQIKNTNNVEKSLSAPQQSTNISGISDSLTLHQCIEKALKNNPNIRYNGLRIEEVNAQRNKAVSQRLPHIYVAGSYYRYSDTQRLAPPRRLEYPLIFTDDVLSYNLILSMPILTGGRIKNEIEAAELLQESAECNFGYTRQELIFNVTSVYFSILKQHKIIESLDFSRTTLEKHLNRINELIEAKKAAKLDKLRIEVRLANIIQRIEQEKNIRSIQHRALANLMGVKEIDFIIPYEDELQLMELEIDVEEILNEAYANRGDYQAVQKDVEAQSKNVRATQAGYLPLISLYGSYGAKQAVGSFIKPNGIDGLEDIGQIGCFIEIPLFEGGRIRANVQENKAKLALLKERQRELELKIRLEVESAVFNLISTKKRILAIEKAVEQANESLRIEIEKYNLGKGSITDILDAESALLEIQTSYYIALADYNIFIAQLKFVQGEA